MHRVEYLRGATGLDVLRSSDDITTVGYQRAIEEEDDQRTPEKESRVQM